MVCWHYCRRCLHRHNFGFSNGCQQTGVWLLKGALYPPFSGHSRAQQADFAFYLLVCPADDFASFCAQDPRTIRVNGIWVLLDANRW